MGILTELKIQGKGFIILWVQNTGYMNVFLHEQSTSDKNNKHTNIQCTFSGQKELKTKITYSIAHEQLEDFN